MMNRIFHVLEVFIRIIGKAVGILAFFAAGSILYELFVRTVFNRPTVWVSESAVFSCAAIYFLAGAWVLQEDGHVRNDLLYTNLTPRRRAFIDCLTYPFFALYIVALLWGGTVFTLDSFKVHETTSSAWDPPLYPIKAIMLLGIVLLLLQGTVKFIRNLIILFRGNTE